MVIVSAGTCTIRAAQAGNANYAAAPNVSQSFTIAQATQTITFDLISNAYVVDGPFAIFASASSGLTVIIASITPSVCTTDGITLTLAGVAGSCTLRASQSGSASYLPAPNVDRTLNVTKIPQTITFVTPANQLLGSPAVSLVASADTGFPVSFASLTPTICTVSANLATPIAAGTCRIRASQSGDQYFAPAADIDRSFLIAISNQTIAFALLSDRAINQSPFAVSAVATSGLPVVFSSVTTAVCTVSGNSVTLVILGTCTVRASQSGDLTYLPAPDVDRSFLVSTTPPVQFFYDPSGNVVRIQRN